MGKKKHSFFNSSLSLKGNIEALIVTFLLFFISNPYFFWQWYGSLLAKIIVTTIAVLFFYKNKKKLSSSERHVVTFYVFVWFVFSVTELLKGARLGIVAQAPYAFLGIIPFTRKVFARAVFQYFTSLYAVLIGFSMVSWVMAVTGLISPIGLLGMDNDSLIMQSKSYLVYPLALVSNNGLDEYLRFSAFFDEPGVVGTLGALMLCALRFNMKDWRCIIILLSGLLSTSFFFYALVGVYWMANLIMVRKSYGTLVVLLTGLLVFYLATKDNKAVSYLVWDRLEWNSSTGTFVGNSRADERSYVQMDKMMASGEIWFGVVDKDKYWEDNFGTSSIYNIIGLYGAVFTAMYIGWLIIVGYCKRLRKWDFILYVFVVIGCSYQRPGLYSILYIFLYSCIARYGELFENKVQLKDPQKTAQFQLM